MKMYEQQIVCEESYGTSSVYRKYIVENRQRTLKMKEGNFSNAKSVFMSIFLPQGFPESVSKDYLVYQLWDSIQAFASSITGTLSTHAILKGVGVGDENATAVAATMTWLIKDGTGMLGRILFAWVNGSNLDCDPKKWRLFADILNDCAIFLDLLSPSMKSLFTPIMCISAISKSLVGVAGGATRAALTQHQAIRNNMADVSAKDGSQETLVNLSALICSLIIMPTLAGNHMLIWCLFIILTLIHLYANYKAVSSIVMDTFNIERFEILVNYYLSSRFEFISISEVNKRESVWIRPWKSLPKIGVSLSEILEGWCDFYTLQNLYEDTFYILNVKLNKLSSAEIRIVLHHHSNVRTQLEALFQACVLQCALHKNKSKYKTLPYQSEVFPEKLTKDNAEVFLKISRDFTAEQFPIFLKHLSELKWNINYVLFKTDEWRATWKNRTNM